MLDALQANAGALGIDVETVACDAEQLPFEDASFDLVFGHAVLHHLPNLDRAFSEFRRVLRPGGAMAFAGEPSRYGDQIASYPKRFAHRAAPAVARADAGAGRRPRATATAAPRTTSSRVRSTSTRSRRRTCSRHAKAAGFEDVRVRGEELLANWFGWTNRGLEASADPETCRWPGASTPTTATSRCRRSTARCWSRGSRRRSSTTS